jgi:putative glutamine amidotransferase
MARPRIVVTLDTGEELRRGVPISSVHMKAAYARMIERANGTPILAAPTDDPGVIEDFVGLMQGLVVTGGAFDIPPELYGRARQSGVRLDQQKPLRTGFETALLRAALAKRIPVLGVCGGMQLLNVILGGTLLQDIQAVMPEALDHEQPTSPLVAYHRVDLERGTALHRLLGEDSIQVNSTHHQAIDVLGRGLSVLGRSEDGVIEAIGDPDALRLTGVQWHPELLGDELAQRIYAGLVELARR